MKQFIDTSKRLPLSKNTMVELVIELEKLSDTNLKKELIGYAKNGEFHDYRSKGAQPKDYFLRCVDHCKPHMIESDVKILECLEEEIKDGEYDEPFTHEDKVHLIKELNQDRTTKTKDKIFFATGMGIKHRKTEFGVRFYI